MRRPTATTVSADKMYDPASSSSPRPISSAASALARASRLAQARGSSPRFGVSSMSAGRSASGSMPAWLISGSRRGEPEASTNFGRPITAAPSFLQKDPATISLEAIGDTTFGQIVGRHFHQHLVAGEHSDTVLAHAARGVGDDLVLVLELDAEGGIRQQFRHHTGKFQQLFFRHSRTEIAGIWPRP